MLLVIVLIGQTISITIVLRANQNLNKQKKIQIIAFKCLFGDKHILNKHLIAPIL